MLTHKRLKELLHYDPNTGIFIWLVRTSNRIHVGDITGSNDSRGYLQIGVCGKLYLAHRLAWLYMTGKWPKDEIDHRDGIRNNNRWENLRPATHTINNQNRHKANNNNRTGFLGVIKVGKRFLSTIGINDKNYYLGVHETPELAHAEYLKAKREFHEGCTI